MSAQLPDPPQISADGKFYWNGERWVSTLSDDQRSRWDGTKWVAAQVGPPGGSQLVQQPAATAVFVYGPQTNSFAVAALIAGIGAWILCPFIAATVAVVCGHVARSQMKASGEGGSGMAIAGLIFGYIQLAIVGVVVALWLLGVIVLFGTSAATRH
jgi:hypothetical protein